MEGIETSSIIPELSHAINMITCLSSPE